MQKIKGTIKQLIKLMKTLKKYDKLKWIKTICQKYFTKLQKMKKTQSKLKNKKIKKLEKQSIKEKEMREKREKEMKVESRK